MPAAVSGSSSYLSIVVTGKDESAAQQFVDRLLGQIRRFGLSAELIVVDGAAGLKLPPEARRVESGAVSEWTARNAGIRAARGAFVLAASIHAIFPDELVQYLAAQELQPGCLYQVGRRASPGSADAVCDIVAPGAGIELGLGWYPQDGDDSAAFRFMENDAELHLNVPAGGGVLRMELEPGPSLSGPSTPLQVIDEKGVARAQWEIAGRDTVRVYVPDSADGRRRIRLHVSEDMLPAPGDTPVLSFRIFRCDWLTYSDVPKPSLFQTALAERHKLPRLGAKGFRDAVRLLGLRGEDVFDQGAEFEPGPGWHYVEKERGGAFRWVERKAELNFCIDDGSTGLALLVESGPSLSHQPFDLVCRMSDGKAVATARVDGLTCVYIPLDVAPGERATLVLSAEGAAISTAGSGDSRELAFRVFACVRDLKRTPQPLSSRRAWAAHTIRTRPPAIDWQAPANAEVKKALEIKTRVHTSTGGDFQLMAREQWANLRGYTEFGQPCDRMDALLSFQTHYLGIREEILGGPLRIGYSGPPQAPASDYFAQQDLNDLVSRMRTLQAPLIFNRTDWDGAVPPSPADPYISVVVAARNDNHGGNMLARMQAFLDSWIGQAQRYNLSSEMIVVEWNPPANRGPLKDELRWPASTDPCAVRFIEVPAEVHRSLANADAIPLHQMIAKNAGIRRARGRFVLCTNLDIIFSPELMQFLGERKLDPQAMYRMDRYDVSNQIPESGNLDEVTGYCRSHIIRVAAAEGTFDTDGGNIRPVESEDILAADCGIRLGSGWYTIEQYPGSPRMRYFDAEGALVHFDRPSGGPRQILFDVEAGPSAQDGWLEVDVLAAAGEPVATVKVDGRCQVALTLPVDTAAGRFRLRTRHGGVALTIDPRLLDLRVFRIEWGGPAPESVWKLEVVKSEPATNWVNANWQSPYAAQMRDPRYLHTNACGDFTMLSREAWFAVRGYPEFPFWPTHLDSLLCYSAYHAGFREVMLRDPMRVFHIDHGVVWTPGSEEERAARAARIGVSLVGYSDLVQYFHYMRRFNAPLIVTQENWGMRDLLLPETGV